MNNSIQRIIDRIDNTRLSTSVQKNLTNMIQNTPLPDESLFLIMQSLEDESLSDNNVAEIIKMVKNAPIPNNIIPEKIDNTEEFALLFKKLRQDHPRDGKTITAQQLSLQIYPNNRAWASQVESRRLKNVKSEDMIAVYEYLLNTNRIAAKQCFAKDYLAYSQKNTRFENTLNQLCKTITSKYVTLENREDQDKLLDILQILGRGFANGYNNLSDILCGFDFTLLNTATSEERKEILDSFDILKTKINSLENRKTIRSFKFYVDKILYFKGSTADDIYQFLSDCNICLSLMSKLMSEGIDTVIRKSFIYCIDNFIKGLYIFSIVNFPHHPFELLSLDNSATIEEMNQAFMNLQKYIEFLKYNINDAIDFDSDI